MKVLSFTELDAWVQNLGWTDLFGITARSPIPVRSFRGEFEPSGVVGADLSVLFLREFMATPVNGGVLCIRRIFPAIQSSIEIIQHLLKQYGLPVVGPANFCFLFEDEFEKIRMIAAWCMACSWEFEFTAIEPMIRLMTNEDDQLTVSWASTSPVASTALEALRNLEFRELQVGD